MIAATRTVRAFVEVYKRARPGLKKASITQIELAVDMLDLWARREVLANELSRDMLLEFRAWRLEERPLPVCKKHGFAMRQVRGTQFRCPQRGCTHRAQHALRASPATANKSVRTLVALWSEAIDQEWNDQRKMRIRPLKEDLDNLHCWDQDDLQKILASCRHEPGELFLPCLTDAFWFALVKVIYYTGSRISAIMELTPADIDWSRHKITLRAATKKDRKCQVITVPDHVIAAIKAIYDPARAYVFPWPYGREKRDWRSLRTRYKRILKRAGLPAEKRDLFHKIRRTTATDVTIATGDLAAARKLLGHSSESVTRRYIDRRRIDETQDSASLLPRIE